MIASSYLIDYNLEIEYLFVVLKFIIRHYFI